MIEMTAFLRRIVLVGVACAVWPAGCVKRTETIIVRQDGSVEIRLEYEGDRKDMESGAPALDSHHHVQAALQPGSQE